MASEIRTFHIRGAHAAEDEATLAAFLRSVAVQRVDTAYADGGWHILVLFEDLRRREETVQIQSAIVGGLNAWRARMATESGVAREAILSDAAVESIARHAPTTEIELATIALPTAGNLARHGAAIVQVVREVLDDLKDHGSD